jgi:hypothetical protein
MNTLESFHIYNIMKAVVQMNKTTPPYKYLDLPRIVQQVLSH